MTPFGPDNPIGGDNFQIARPMPVPHAPVQHNPRRKRMIPEVDELFAAQKALVKAINHLHNANQDDEYVRRAQERAQGAYKRLRNWLADHGNEGVM